MRLLQRHLINVQALLVVHDLHLGFLGLVVGAPALLGYQSILVDRVKHNQNEARCALDNAQHEDDQRDVLWHIGVSVVVYSLKEE